jgi:hypothetical protein
MFCYAAIAATLAAAAAAVAVAHKKNPSTDELLPL